MLLTFQDLSAANNATSAELSVPSPQAEAAPPLPPCPAPKTGINRVAKWNEVTADGEGSVEDYSEYAEGLLAVRLTHDCPVDLKVDIKPAIGCCDAVHHYLFHSTCRRTQGPMSS
jgi:hypothetical protein